jgi:hypothetical protein
VRVAARVSCTSANTSILRRLVSRTYCAACVGLRCSGGEAGLMERLMEGGTSRLWVLAEVRGGDRGGQFKLGDSRHSVGMGDAGADADSVTGLRALPMNAVVSTMRIFGKLMMRTSKSTKYGFVATTFTIVSIRKGDTNIMSTSLVLLRMMKWSFRCLRALEAMWGDLEMMTSAREMNFCAARGLRIKKSLSFIIPCAYVSDQRIIKGIGEAY